MRTLVDTSVWIDHFRHRNSRLVDLLEGDDILVHPFVIGEIACGHLKNRNMVIDSLSRLPYAPIASAEECLSFIDNHKLFGLGLGFVDVNLLASSLICSARLLTLDKKLHKAAENLPHR